MDESDVPIEVIRAEIEESLGRAKALVEKSERFVRERIIFPAELKEVRDQSA